jgi:hypothetical protein
VLKQLPLIAFSLVMLMLMVQLEIRLWWVWAVWAVVLICQIGVGLGWQEKLSDDYESPKRRRQRELARERWLLEREFAAKHAEHEAKVRAWLEQQNEKGSANPPAADGRLFRRGRGRTSRAGRRVRPAPRGPHGECRRHAGGRGTRAARPAPASR